MRVRSKMEREGRGPPVLWALLADLVRGDAEAAEMTALQDRLYALLQENPRRTVRELQALANVKSTSTVSYNLKILAARGLIERKPGLSRAITLAGRCPCCGGTKNTSAGS